MKIMCFINKEDLEDQLKVLADQNSTILSSDIKASPKKLITMVSMQAKGEIEESIFEIMPDQGNDKESSQCHNTIKAGVMNKNLQNFINTHEIVGIMTKEVKNLDMKFHKAKIEEENRRKAYLKKQNSESTNKRFKTRRKAPIPVFSKIEISDRNDSCENSKINMTILKKNHYQFHKVPEYYQMRSSNQKAESALERWRKEKLGTYKNISTLKRKKASSSMERRRLKPRTSMTIKGLFSKENPVMPIKNSTPREEVVNKPVEARLISFEPLPQINMINVDKFYTQELDKIIEIDQE